MDFNLFNDYRFWLGLYICFALLMPVVVGRMNHDDDELEEQARRHVEDEEQHLYDNHH